MRLRSILVVVILCLAFCAGDGWADLSDGLITWYDFSKDADDVSGNGHDGTVYGASLTSDRFGHPNRAYSFDGVDDYISVPFASAFDSPSMTLAAWIRPSRDLSPGASTTVIMARGEDLAKDRLWGSLEVMAEDDPWGTGTTLLYEDIRDTERVYDTGVFPPTDAWTHVAATRSIGGVVTLFINGSLIGQWTGTPVPAMAMQELTIGARWWSPTTSGPYSLAGFFPGAIDEVRIYNRALTADEVADLAPVPLPGAALLGMLGLGYAGMRLRRNN